MTSTPSPDPYATLGVPKDATSAAIKTAYRKLVLKCHPDKIKDESLRDAAADQFQKVQQSYEVLIDDEKRAKHDDKVKLAELKEKLAKEHAAARSGSYSERPSPTTTPSYRTARTYEPTRTQEARTPKTSYVYEDEYYDDYRGDRYREDLRASARKHEEYERQTRREADERKKTKSTGLPSSMEKILREHARSARENTRSRQTKDAKLRESGRRREAEEKRSYTTRVPLDVEDTSSSSSSSSSDSEDDYYPQRQASSSRRYEDVRQPSKSEPVRPKEVPRRSRHDEYMSRGPRRSREDGFADDGRWEQQDREMEQGIRDYIQRSKTEQKPERHADRGPPPARSASSRYHEAPVQEEVRRSSGRSRSKTGATSSTRDRKGVADVVVEALQREKRPAMPSASSAPAQLKSMLPGSKSSAPQPHRSATAQYPSAKPAPAPIRRSETSPLVTSAGRKADASRSSKLKSSETYDSGYSSPNTPDQPAPPSKTTKYTIVDPADDYSKPRSYMMEPDDFRREKREVSPPKASERDRERERQRPTVQTRPSLSKGTRTYSYSIEPQGQARPIPSRNESQYESPRVSPATSRPAPAARTASSRPLYREVTGDYATYSPDKIHYADPLEKVSYSNYDYPRRGAEPVREKAGRHYSESYRPSLHRAETSA